MKKLLALLLTCALCVGLTLPPRVALGQGGGNHDASAQGRPTGRILNSYRKGQGPARPAWVDDALRRSLAYLKRNGRAHGLADAEAELELLGADQDDLGQTHVRLDQVYRGVPVYGGQLITHLEASDARPGQGRKAVFANGHVFPDARRVDTTPRITPEKAIELAKAALDYEGGLAREGAELVILPETVKKGSDAPGATLTYKVELVVDDPAAAADHLYFINAHSGRVEWHYDDLKRGVGNSMYSGQINIGTVFNFNTGRYEMRDPGRSDARLLGRPGIFTTDVFGNTNVDGPPGSIFTDFDDVWGDGTNFNRQTAGVDAHYGAMLTYDYYLNRHGRLSLDNANLQMCNRTHFGRSDVGGSWSDFSLCTSYADSPNGNHWAAVDVVGHEFTHGVTRFTANLIYQNQSGGANEAFSDIFGTMIEFYSGIRPDYVIAEDVNGGIRDMSNPSSNNRAISHFSRYHDGMDPHDSSGLQNVAFYLLAESGTHPFSGVSVKRIGRDGAANVYYRALAVYLTRFSVFSDVRRACEFAAADLYSSGNPIYHAVQRSWFASGVGGDVPFNPIDVSSEFVSQHYRDFLLREPDPWGLQFWTNEIEVCGSDAGCEDFRRKNTSRAFWNSGEFQQRPDVQASGLLTGDPSRPFDNSQFVRWCYKIYLQREPDPQGWQFWLDDLNRHGDYNQTIRAFLVSFDYRGRFGPA